jgi:hypothetical protein
MAATTLLAALKAVLPYVDTIVSVATPLLTKKKLDAGTAQTELLQQQIAELQAAASQNAENIKEVAEQLKTVVLALEGSAANLERAHRRLRVFCIVAIALAATALAFVLYQR